MIKDNETFAPKIKIHDQFGVYDVVPRGWEWVLGFALAGCDWAIREADTEKFRKIIHKDLEKTYKEKLEAKTKEMELKITQLKNDYLQF